jgi:hypothetical protein
MGYLTREELDRRIEEDDRDPEETVYVLQGAFWQQDRRKGKVYHCEENCGCIKSLEEMTRMTRREAQERGKAPCMRAQCHGETSTPDCDLHDRLLAADPDEVSGDA